MRPQQDSFLHGTPGLAAFGAIALLLALALGVPGLHDGEAPFEQHVQSSIDQERIARGGTQHALTPITDTAEPRPRKPRKRKRARPDGPFVRDYRAVAMKEAKRAGIRRPILFVRQMAAESGFQPCVKSPAGALGIAQIMPDTARSWRVDPFDANAALAVAARHMATYERQYGGSYRLALAAYNAGPGAVARYGGVPPYAETRSYVGRIMDRRQPLLGMRQVYRLPGRMQPGFAHRLRRLQAAVKRRGGRLIVAEGFRSQQEQTRLWVKAKRRYGGWRKARAWVAPPGCSNHNRGWAADLAGSLTLAHQLAPAYGLTFPMAREPWHIELAGLSTQSS